MKYLILLALIVVAPGCYSIRCAGDVYVRNDLNKSFFKHGENDTAHISEAAKTTETDALGNLGQGANVDITPIP